MQGDKSNIFPEEIIENICSSWTHDTKSSQTGPFPSGLTDEVLHICADLGIKALYKHQSESIEAVLNGDSVLITTGTSSGKSLCYQIPIINGLFNDPDKTSLLLFPTKALSVDQQKNFSKMLAVTQKYAQNKSSRAIVGIYDGDTDTKSRSTIRNISNILISNPDMLHMGILPHHPSWEGFFSNLKYIVIDEAHTYSGVFGSHFANVIRRLKRIANYYGASPQFILTSATVGNPKTFAESLIEEPVTIFDQDDSKHAPKTFIFYNPPVIDKDLGVRKSMTEESVNISRYLLMNGLQTILFSKSRQSVEYLYRKFIDRFGRNRFAISPYRSGYRKSDRREIEKGLKSGEINLVISTIALELGIDMGMVDAIIMNGYPGSISRFIQQAGRAGRNERSALCIYIASSSPLDQYIVRHPEYVKDKHPENIYLDPNNPFILFNHIRCSSFELSFSPQESFGGVKNDEISKYLDVLVETKSLYLDKNRYFWISDHYPASDISIRSALGFSYKLFANNSLGKHENIGEIDPQSIYKLTHPGAIYFHLGTPLLVDSIDEENRIINLSRVKDPIFITEPIVHVEASIEKTEHVDEANGYLKGFGDVRVIEDVRGYKKVLIDSTEVISIEELNLPPEILDTKGTWLAFSDNIVNILREKKLWGNAPNDYGPKWSAIRTNILERDNFTCQLCGVTPSKNRLHVHHIKPFRTFLTPYAANKSENLITLCNKCHTITEQNLRIRSTLSGLGFSLQNIIPVFINCAPHDIGYSIVENIGNNQGTPGLLIFDQYPGGIGLSINIFNKFGELLNAVSDLVTECPCLDGCPSCVGPGGENGTGSKNGVKELLRLIASKKSYE